MSEIFKPIPGYEGRYMVSNRGNVLSLSRKDPRGRRINEKILRPRVPQNKRQYPHVCLRKNNETATLSVHALVLLAFCGPRPEGQESRHLNGNHLDNRWPENLAWGTPLDNHNDRKLHGTMPIGSRQWKAKLDENEVASIKRFLGCNVPLNSLAETFGVDTETIRDIKNGRSWKHVEALNQQGDDHAQSDMP